MTSFKLYYLKYKYNYINNSGGTVNNCCDNSVDNITKNLGNIQISQYDTWKWLENIDNGNLHIKAFVQNLVLDFGEITEWGIIRGQQIAQNASEIAMKKGKIKANQTQSKVWCPLIWKAIRLYASVKEIKLHERLEKDIDSKYNVHNDTKYDYLGELVKELYQLTEIKYGKETEWFDWAKFILQKKHNKKIEADFFDEGFIKYSKQMKKEFYSNKFNDKKDNDESKS